MVGDGDRARTPAGSRMIGFHTGSVDVGAVTSGSPVVAEGSDRWWSHSIDLKSPQERRSRGDCRYAGCPPDSQFVASIDPTRAASRDSEHFRAPADSPGRSRGLEFDPRCRKVR